MNKIWNWIKNTWEYCGSDPDALAQLGHVGWGGFLTLAVSYHANLVGAAGIVFVFAVLKEVSEYWTETGETRGSTMQDIAFWTVGIVLASIASAI